jgi:hypothetical protein
MNEATEKTILELLGLIQRCCKPGPAHQENLPELVKATAELIKVHKEI